MGTKPMQGIALELTESDALDVLRRQREALVISLPPVAEWELLKIRELAELLQLNQQTVRNMVNRGELEYLKLGRTKYIPRAAAAALAGGTGTEIPELLTVAQVAKLFRLHEMTIRSWIEAGTLPAVWIGERRVRIKREDLDAFIGASSYAKGQQFWDEAPPG
jgi:excisionase family DNA binding protein